MLRATLAALMLAPGVAAAAQPPAPPLPLLGDYLDTAYIKTLQKTRSPLLAAAEDAQAGMPQLVSVQPQGAARRFAANFNWREGRLLFVLSRNFALHRELAWGPDPEVALRIAGAGQFCLTPPRGSEHCYRHVGNAQDFISRITLAGQYLDRQGAAYRFGADGQAHFPGYDFAYALVLEQVSDQYDFFAVGTEGRFMAFRRAGETITLYPVGPGHGAAYGTPDFAHPLAVLREQPGPRVVASN